MSIAFIVFIILAIGLFVLRVPVGMGMLISSVFYFIISGQNFNILASKVINTYSSFILLSIPLFIFTAEVMNSGEITNLIFKFSTGFVGKLHGKTAYVNVIASFIFSGMTGSAIADASGLGEMEIKQMQEEKYGADFACAITAASATIGPIFPPSIPMVIYAMLSGASIKALFLNGIIPGALLGFFLMIYIYFISKKRNYPKGQSYSVCEFIELSMKALPAILTPVLLLGAIYTGIITPTEAGAIARLYAIIISLFIYKTLSLKSLWAIISRTVTGTGTVAIILGVASVVSYIVSVEGIAVKTADLLASISSSPVIFLLAINIVLLALGMVVDTSVILAVFVPIIVPAAKLLGVDIVHLGIVITLNIMIGLSTPPFGMLLFITSGISGTPLRGIIKEILPILGVMISLLLLITYFPEILFI